MSHAVKRGSKSVTGRDGRKRGGEKGGEKGKEERERGFGDVEEVGPTRVVVGGGSGGEEAVEPALLLLLRWWRW